MNTLKSKIFVASFGIIISLIIFSCNKEYIEEPEDTSESIEFISLEASTYRAKVWDTIWIKVTVIGDSLEYKWQKNSGSMVKTDNPNEVIYWGCYSCIGKNTITCTASNSTGEKSKSVEVEVYR